MNLHAQGGHVSPGKSFNLGAEGPELFVPNKSLSEADEAVKRFESEEFAKEFSDNLHRAIWKIVGPPINRAIKRIIEDSKRQRAEQWQSVADARERQERGKAPLSGLSAPRSVGGILGRGIYWHEPDERETWAERRARVNNELWLNEEPQAFQPLTKGQGWIVAGVIVMACITLWLLYVASCGAVVDGRCWK